MGIRETGRITLPLCAFFMLVLSLGGCILRSVPEPAPPPAPILYLAISQPLDQSEVHAPAGEWATVPIEVTWNGESRPGSLVVSVTGPKGISLPVSTENITTVLTVNTSGSVHHARGSISLRGFAESPSGTLYTLTASADLRQPAQNGFIPFAASRELRVYRASPLPSGNLVCPPGSTDPRCR